MPKQIKELKDFSGGLNTKHDSKDIKDNEFIEAKGVMFDKPGRIRTSRRSEVANDGTNAIANYDSVSAEKLENGYGLGFINSDTQVDKVRISIAAGNADSWVGKYISMRDSADDGNWLSTNHTVFKVVQFVNDVDYVYCFTVRPGSAGEQYSTQAAQGYNIFLSDAKTGTSPTDTGLSFSGSAETLNSTDDWTGTDHWDILDPTGGSGTPNWSIVGSGSGSYAKFLTASNTSPEFINVMYQKESENIGTWVADTWYMLKVTFVSSYALSSGNLMFSFLGKTTFVSASDVVSNVIEIPIQSGSAVANDSYPWSNFCFYANDNTNNDIRIESISLKSQVSWVPSTDPSDDTSEGEANLVVVNATDNTLDRYSYFSSEWFPVLKTAPYTGLGQAKLQNLSISSAGVGTLADKTSGKVLLYTIDGAVHFVDTNFNTSHQSDLYANYWYGFIDKKFFSEGVTTNHGFKVKNWTFSLMDIYPPYSGTLHTSAITTPTLSDGYLSMMARVANPATSQTVWESGADPDGWFAGKSGASSVSYQHNRGASFPKDLLDTATGVTSNEGMVGAYCFSKDYSGAQNDENYLLAQYHADYDYKGGTGTSPSATANVGLNMHLASQKTLYFDMYISSDCYGKISDTNGVIVHLGSYFTFHGAWNSSGRIGFRYRIPKVDIVQGWETYSIILDNWDDINGGVDKENLTKFALEIHLTSGGADVGEVGTSGTVLTTTGSQYVITSESTAPSGGSAANTNHYRQFNLAGTPDFSALGWAVGDLLWVSIDGSGSEEAEDEYVTIVGLDDGNDRVFVTRPYLDQNIWASSTILSGGASAVEQTAITDTTSKVKLVSAVPNPACAISDIRYGDLVEGEWNGEYKFFYSWVYDGKQESKLYEYTGTVSASDQSMYFNFWIKEGIGGGFGLASTLGLQGYRIDKARIYYSKVSEEGDLIDKRYYLLGELDLDLGFKFSNDEKYYPWRPDPLNSTLLCIDVDTTTTTIREDLISSAPPVVDVFESSAGYSNSTKSIMATFKDIAFNNGIAYVASPYQATNTSIGTIAQSKKSFPDRILKSLPNNYDVFPSDNFIDVVVDDGESVIAIETFNDRLLQFKQNTLYVINIAGELEFLEDTFTHLGVQSKDAIAKSDVGILFANRNGIYLYPGSGEPVNLTGKVNETDWNAFAGDGTSLVCIYIPSMDQLVVAKTSASDAESDTYIVDIPTQTVSKTTDGLDLSEQYGYTNVVLDTVNGQPIWISDDNTNEKVYTIDNFDDSTSASAGHASGNFELKTKFYDFDRPGVRKKIHKVRINYKSTGITNVSVKFDVDQGSAFTKQFSNGTNFTSDELANTSGAWYIAELKPDTSSEVNNIYSFALKMYSDGIVPEDFQINDISIVYRYKSVK